MHERVGVVGAAGGDAHVGSHGQHLLEAFTLVEALREPETGASDAGQRFAPADQILWCRRVAHDRER